MKMKIFKDTVCKKNAPLIEVFIWVFNVVFVVTLLLSCNKNRKNSQCELEDSIVVAYFPYIFDANISVTCKYMMSSAYKKKTIDTIILPHDYFYNLKDSLKKYKIIGKKIFDCRILIKFDGYNIGIDQFLNVMDENENIVELSPELIYTILKKIKYFNYFSMEDLEYSYIIEHFGMPDDYKYIPLKDSMKVIKEGGGFEYISKPKGLRKIYIVPSK